MIRGAATGFKDARKHRAFSKKSKVLVHIVGQWCKSCYQTATQAMVLEVLLRTPTRCTCSWSCYVMNLAPRCAVLTARPQKAPHSIMGYCLWQPAVSCTTNDLYCVHVQTVVLLGHSTGCQDNVRYMQKYSRETPNLAGVILQAPVSPPSLTFPL